MSPYRLTLLTATIAALAAPLAAQSASDSATTSAACAAAPMTLTERRVAENATAGMPALISFVHRTQPIYQLRVDDAVAIVDAQRARKEECTMVSARATSD
jgi:hypothetical protein